MKTTIDLPDDLMHRVRIRAVHEQKKLKDVLAEAIGAWLEQGRVRSAVKSRKLPKPVPLKGRGPLTIEEIEAAINWGRE
ncbi:MAG: hypothetical protein Q8922_01475 [Bacteroidota bacterium]|nr:hypothetical protein [Bacteroidota bacterium]MDP4232102.1 hypothetical protein [Bacteroidota bacterium]MDP4241190.1 hypothetical protein [Bacteroidota bacterium]MDP4286582.1 hypothetical protein [Bacteroidota bacterium]